MTLSEFGLKLRKRYPKLNEVALNNQELALRVLKQEPDLWDLISPTARRIKEISDRQPSSQRWTEKGRIESEGMMVQNWKSEIQMLHQAGLTIKAESMGVPVESLAEMAMESHRTDEFIRKERFIRDNGLEGATTARLSSHDQIERLQRRILNLIDERDRESHPDKRRVLQTTITGLERELNGRILQTVVQAGGGNGLGESDPSTDRGAGGGTSAQGNVEPVSVKGFGMGVRR